MKELRRRRGATGGSSRRVGEDAAKGELVCVGNVLDGIRSVLCTQWERWTAGGKSGQRYLWSPGLRRARGGAGGR